MKLEAVQGDAKSGLGRGQDTGHSAALTRREGPEAT